MAVEPNYFDTIICYFCNGEGQKVQMRVKDPMKLFSPTAYEKEVEKCPACEGTGRLKLYFKPFKQENQE